MFTKYRPISNIILKLRENNISSTLKYKKALKKRAANSLLAKNFPKEYKKGIEYIKNIILLRENTMHLYLIGKQKKLIFEQMPELNKKNTFKEILIATNHPMFDIYKINSLVETVFSKSETERKEIIFEIISQFSHNNYGYLFS